MELGFDDKVFAITGGTDGLGLSLAQRLVAEGARVAICGRDGDRLAAALSSFDDGAAVLGMQADVSTAQGIDGFVHDTYERFGRLDGVVHNAGKSAAMPLEASDDEAWESDIALKVMGAVRLTRAALPHLKERGGAVLFTLATAAKAAGPGSAPSSVSRAAGMTLMKALSKELGPHDIRVNALLIGLIESGQWVRAAAAGGQDLGEFYEGMAKGAGIPLGRVGRAEEFADVAAFLLSQRASYVTGTAINLDGGLSPVV